MRVTSSRLAFAQPSIDLGNLLDPTPAVAMLQIHDLVERPMEMVGNVGYLLVEALQGVAYNSPIAAAVSTSNWCPHSGHATVTSALPLSLIRR